jgi:VanZ family protein
MISTTIHGIRIASICLVGYWLALFAGTHMPRVRMPGVVVASNDKVLHLMAFAGLSFLLSWAIPTSLSDRFRNVRWAALAAICYGAFDELTQIPVGRTADWQDLIADIIGAFIGITAYCILREVLWKIKSIHSAESAPAEEHSGLDTRTPLPSQATR